MEGQIVNWTWYDVTVRIVRQEITSISSHYRFVPMLQRYLGNIRIFFKITNHCYESLAPLNR